MHPITRLLGRTARRETAAKISSPIQLQLRGSFSRQQSRSYAAIPCTPKEQKEHSAQNAQDKRAAQQNRHRIDRQSDEVSKSGTDDAVAAQMSVSFEKTDSSLDELRADSGEQNPWGNPLDASPANRSLSEGTDEVKTGLPKKQVTVEKSFYQSESKLKQGKAGFEKEAFAGSSRTVKEKERPPTIRPGAR